jgi:hypothetical protein
MSNFRCPSKDHLRRRLIEAYRALGDAEDETTRNGETVAHLEMRFIENELYHHDEICPLCKIRVCVAAPSSELSWRGTMAS